MMINSTLLFAYLVLANNTLQLDYRWTDGDSFELANMTHQDPSLMGKLSPHQLLSMPDPWTIDTIQPKIVFYKPGLKEYEVKYTVDPKALAATLNSTGFLDCDRLVLITHGFHNNFDTDWLHGYKDTLFNVSASTKTKMTVGIIGWGGGADILVFRYRQAAANVLTVGDWLSNYTRTIKEMRPSVSLYGIGHSLGAHVMGIAGRISKAFDRITGRTMM